MRSSSEYTGKLHVREPQSCDLLFGVYCANKSNPWDKIVITDPVFISSKLYKNGKFELELVSGEMARKTAVFLFALGRENRVQV